jgi:hypothetical protein
MIKPWHVLVLGGGFCCLLVVAAIVIGVFLYVRSNNKQP